MSMYSQSELLHRSEIFTTNGLKPEAQAVIAGVGYGPDEIAEGAAILAAVKAACAGQANLASRKRKATVVEKIAHGAAHKEIVSLSETCCTLFAGNHSVLALLGLQNQHETVNNLEIGEQGPPAACCSATADTLAHWRQLVGSVERLEAAEKALLTSAGWSAARLCAVRTLVEGYATADTMQQSVIDEAKAARAALKASVKDLQTWYGRARRLSSIRLKEEDPAKMERLVELLGIGHSIK